MLSPYRVVDLTNERGLLAGQIFADLGADVIQVEPPGGSTARNVAPFFDEPVEGAERSIYWACYARNKRSVTCDIQDPRGRDLLLRLIANADFLFESSNVGRLSALGLDYEALQAVNPKLIYTSISPFGQDGPKARYEDTSLILWASGGPLVHAGDADRPPIRISVPQAYLHAAGDAADGALVAHFDRLKSGLGQHVDISTQQSVAQATLSQILAHQVGAPEPERSLKGLRIGAATIRTKWEALDGWVELSLGMGTSTGHFSNNLLRWMVDEGVADPELLAIDWREMPARLISGETSADDFQAIQTTVEEFVRTKTKEELLDAAVKNKLLLVPHSTVASLATNEHLEARGFWKDVERDGRAIQFPGPFVNIPGRELQYARPAPTVGEHNHEVLVDELGLSEQEFGALAEERVI